MPPGFDLLVDVLLNCRAVLGHLLGELVPPRSLDPTGALAVLRDALREFLAPVARLHGGKALVMAIAILEAAALIATFDRRSPPGDGWRRPQRQRSLRR